MESQNQMDQLTVKSTGIETKFRADQAVLKAARFAAQKHAGQRRKGTAVGPYILIAALLHDTIEDTEVTQNELAQAFGPDVVNLVTELTDDKSLPKAERKRLQIVRAPELSLGHRVIKLADRISNLREFLSARLPI